MAFTPNVWNQIKNLSADALIKALQRDGFQNEGKSGAVLGFYKPGNPAPRRITIHYHPGKTYQPKLLTALIAAAGWDENDLRRLKLIK
jgi:predicted RNA binding protein YcfA (HicA-like mRNA interferase family)